MLVWIGRNGRLRRVIAEADTVEKCEAASQRLMPRVLGKLKPGRSVDFVFTEGEKVVGGFTMEPSKERQLT